MAKLTHEQARAQAWEMLLEKATEAHSADPKAAAAAKTLLADPAWQQVIEAGVTASPVTGRGEPPGGTPGSGGADAGELMLALNADVLAPALADVTRAAPELIAALGEDRLREILAEVTAEQLARRAARHG
jgi:hypothetical protein